MDAPNKSATNGHSRDVMGRFGPGNNAARGHVGIRRMTELRRAVMESETAERVLVVVDKLRELASEGDVAAAKVYLDTVIGKAPQAVEISGPDGERIGSGVQELISDLSRVLAPYPEELRFDVLMAIRRANRADADE